MENFTIVELEFLRGAITRQRAATLSSFNNKDSKAEAQAKKDNVEMSNKGIQLVDYVINKKTNEMLNELTQRLPAG